MIPAIIITERHHPESKPEHSINGEGKYPVQAHGYYPVALGGVTQLHKEYHSKKQNNKNEREEEILQLK